MSRHEITRRAMLSGSTRGLLAGGAAMAGGFGVTSMLQAFEVDGTERQFKIGACDWSIGHSGSLKAFEFARQLGLDGVEVNFPKPEENDLRTEAGRKAYLAASKAAGVEISSVALAVLNGVPFSSSPKAIELVEQCIDMYPQLFPERQKKVALMAFFGPGNIKGAPELQAEVIRRLQRIAPLAEKAGVVLGLETWLDVDDHMRILDGVDSPAVQVYYDTANMHAQGYDIYKDIRRLGRERICQFHCKENSSVLGAGPIDFAKVKEAIDDIGYCGWLVIESAKGKDKSILESYQLNQKHLETVFNA